MNPPCKTARPRKSKTRTRDAIRPHNRKRRAPLPRATIIVTNSGGPQPGMRVSATPCNRRRLPRERRTSLPGAATVSPNKSGGRQPPVGSGSALATATWHSSENLRAATKSGGRQPAVAQNCIGNGNRSHTRPTEQPSVGSENALATSGEGCRMPAGERSPPWVRRCRVLRSVP
jgi:hypothetical protein